MIRPNLSQPAAARRRLLGGFGALVAVLPCRTLAAAAALPRVSAAQMMMGTRVDLIAEAVDARLLAPAAEAAFAEMARLAAIMSAYRPDSRVSALQRAAGERPLRVEPELMAVLQAAQSVSQRSGGAFDATVGALGLWHGDFGRTERVDARRLAQVDHRALHLDATAGTAWLGQRGMRLDLGGIAKLPILAAGLQRLRDHGVASALLNGGGDVLAFADAARAPWQVGVRDPMAPRQLLGVLALRDGVVASSGDYLRCVGRGAGLQHHIVEPRSGRSSSGLHGVTLLAGHVDAVNGLGAAAMVLGAGAGPRWLAEQPGVEWLTVDASATLQASAGMRQRLRPA